MPPHVPVFLRAFAGPSALKGGSGRLALAMTLAAVLAAGAAEAQPAAAPAAPAASAKARVDSPYETATQPRAQGRIDELVFARLRRLGIERANGCTDAVFVRRVFLDAIGTLPTAEEARAFLEDKSPDKRRLLIDRLLERDEYADYWAMKWSDLLRVKAEYPINLWPNAAQAYHHWIRASLKANKPFDAFARELLTPNGSNFRAAPVNFYRAIQSRKPEAVAQTVALTFMGARTEKWPAERLAGMSVFFSQLAYKSTAEWKEEIVFFDPTKAPAGGVTGVFPDGRTVAIPAGHDPREAFADWLVDSRNPWFARAAANRVWAWLLGRGIVDEPDDLRPDNPPANPELLALLERELVAARYDLKHLFRLILNSSTYQLSCLPRSTRPEAAAHFASYPLRRLDAEVLIDALNQITGTGERYSSAIPEPFTFIPENARSIALPDGSITSSFLEMFGRPPRDTGRESERNNRSTAVQRLHLLNSSHIQRKLEQGPALRELLRLHQGQPRELVDAVYLTILSRQPTEAERRTLTAQIRPAAGKGREAALDLVWALVNSSEFLHRH